MLAWPKVRFCGEAVAAVVAADRYLAEDASGLVAVEYEPLPAVADVGDARGAAAVVHDEAPDNILLSRRFDHGDVERRAGVVVRGGRARVSHQPADGGAARGPRRRGGLECRGGQAHALLGHAGAAPRAPCAGRDPRAAREPRAGRRSRRRRRLRRQGHRLSRGRRALPARHAPGAAREMGGDAARGVHGLGPRPRPSLRRARGLRRRRALDRHGRPRRLQRGRVFRLSVDGGHRGPHGRRASHGSLQAGSLPLRGGGAGDEHDAGGSVSRGGPAGHHVRDGARARPRGPRARPRSRRDPARQPRRPRRSALHVADAAGARQSELSGRASRRSSRRSAMARSGRSRRGCAPRGATSASGSRATTS